MTHTRLNIKLISSLGSVLRMSAAEMIDAVSIPTATWYRLMKAPADITIQQLLSIANGLHIPVRHFFSTDAVDVIGHRDDYVIEPYEPCCYNSDVLLNIISSSPEKTWKQAAEIAGMVPFRLKDSLLAFTRTPVTRFLIVCEAFCIDPFTVISDPNTQTSEKGEHTKTKNDITILREINSLRQDVRHLTSMIEDMSQKYDNLLFSHKLLLEHLNKNNQQPTIGIAAEPDPEPNPD